MPVLDPPAGTGTSSVTSVAGRIGAVLLTNTDISGLGTASTAASTAFDAAGAAAAVTAASIGAATSTALTAETTRATAAEATKTTTAQAAAAARDGSNFPVISYGAYGVAQSAATNTATVNAAILAARTAGGGIVQFPATVGPVDLNPFLVYSNLWYRGAGDGGTWLRLRAGVAATLFSLATPNEDLFRISDMTIDGNRANCTGAATLMSFDHTGLTLTVGPAGGRATTSPITEVSYPAFESTALYGGSGQAGSTRMLIDHLTIVNSTSHGIYFSANGEYYMKDCLVTHHAGDGIQFLCHDSMLADTTVSDCGGKGVFVLGYSRMSDVKIYCAAGTGLYVANGYMTLTGVEVEQCPGDGFQFAGPMVFGRNLKSTANGGIGFSFLAGATGCDIVGYANNAAVWAYDHLACASFAPNVVGNRIRIKRNFDAGSALPVKLAGAQYFGNDMAFDNEEGTQSVAYAATITPDPVLGRRVFVGVLTANLTVANPSGTPYAGQRLQFMFTQDATGTRTVTFGNFYRTLWTPTTTANVTNSIQFEYDGLYWTQTGATVGIPAGAAFTTQVSDTFTRTSVSVLGTADTGQAWTALLGTWGTNGTQAYLTAVTSQAAAVLDSLVSDCTVQALVAVTGDAGLVARCTDNNNYLTVGVGTNTILYKRVAGTYTQIGATAAACVNGDTITLVMSGSTLTVKKNGTTIITGTDSFNSTATKHGFRSNGDTGARMDNFLVTIP